MANKKAKPTKQAAKKVMKEVDPEDEALDDEALEDEALDDEALEDEEGIEIVDLDVDPEELDDEVDPILEDDDFVVAEETFDDDEDDDADEATPAARRSAGIDDEDDDDMTTPDDVEADLDTILKDRLVAADDIPVEDDEETDVDDRNTDGDRLQPRRADEELCSQCFLLVRRTAPNCPVGDDACPIFVVK